jgi:hypothetical protein
MLRQFMIVGHGPFRIFLSRLVHLIMVVGQLALFAAASTEGVRGFSAAPHVEQYGVDQHYSHVEATCVACIVLSLHARGEASRIPVPLLALLPGDVPTTAPTAVIVRRDTGENPSRAPPTLG